MRLSDLPIMNLTPFTAIKPPASWEEFFTHFSFKFPMVYISLKIGKTQDSSPGLNLLDLTLDTLHRDTNQIVTIRSTQNLHPIETVANPLAYIRQFIIQFIVHEIDESILYKGERIYDPHKNDLHY